MPPRRLTLVFALVFAVSAPLLRAQHSPPAVHVPTATLDTYVGQYRDQNEPDDVLSVFRDDDRLYIEGPRTPRIDLTAESITSFKPNFAAHYIFLADPAGHVTGFHFTGPEDDLFDKISSQPEPNHFRPYARQEVMIPMRDGVKLHAIVFRPTDTKEPSPSSCIAPPTASNGDIRLNGCLATPSSPAAATSSSMEDIRGRYKSQGTFVMMRPLADHHDPSAIDECTDTYDTVAWLLKHIPATTAASASWAFPTPASSLLKPASIPIPPSAPSPLRLP